MNITRDVVKDLLPLYVAGEASTDSRAAVESFLATDRELSTLAASMREDAPAAAQRPRAPMGQDRAVLERTRTLLRRRTWFLAAAVLCSVMPFAFSFDGSGIRFLLVRDAPAVGGVLMVGAFLFWALFASTARRMRVTGL
jgi:anti-sigma factor RsiW